MMDEDSVWNLAYAAIGELPDEVQDGLQGVELSVITDHQGKCRGMFEGVPAHDPGYPDDPSGIETPPIGTITLNAAMMESSEDVAATLYHEVGHALGMDEEEVALMLEEMPDVE